MKTAIDKFRECVKYESNNIQPIINEGKVTQFMLKLAKSINQEDKLIHNGERYNYLHANGNLSTIDMNTKQCTCITFLDKAICKHLIAACLKKQY